MSSKPIGRLEAPLSRSLESKSVMQVVPSWLVSVAVHVALFFVLASTLRGCTTSVGAGHSDEFRTVGIVLRDTVNPDASQELPSEPLAQPQSTSRQMSPDIPQELPDQPPVALTLPQTPLPVIGQGNPVLPSAGGADVRDVVQSAGPRNPSALNADRGETSFIDIRDSGSRFVYLIDCSGSMFGDPMKYAKAQLKSSLRRLERKQQFQVIFYNKESRMISLRSQPGQNLYWATGVNLSESDRAIDAVQPDFGTDHLPAIRRALALEPEVLYFLTDAEEPRLSAGELEIVRRRNGGRSRIHCIQFGEGPELNVDTWLKRMAAQNGGVYRYVNVDRLIGSGN